MKLQHVARMPWLAIPFIGGIIGFVFGSLPILFLTKVMGDQYKDDIIETTWVRHDGSQYTTRRGSYAPGLIVFVGLGIILTSVVYILNFIEKTVESPFFDHFYYFTFFSFILGLARYHAFADYVNSKEEKDGINWLFWAVVVLTLAWPFTPIEPLFEIQKSHMPWVYLPITLFLFFGFVLPIMASLQIFTLAILSKSYKAIALFLLLPILQLIPLGIYHISRAANSLPSQEKAIVPLLVISSFTAAVIIVNAKIWQFGLSSRQNKLSFIKIPLIICGLISGSMVLLGGVLSVILIRLYDWSGFIGLALKLAELSMQYDTKAIAYLPLAIITFAFLISIITTLNHRKMTSGSKFFISGASSIAIIPIMVFLAIAGIKTDPYRDVIKNNIENNTVSVFMNVYKAPDGIKESDKLNYMLGIIKENLFSDDPLLITSGSSISALKQKSQYAEDNYTITVTGRKPASQNIEQGVSLAEGEYLMTFQRGGKSVTKTIFILDSDIEHGYKTDTIEIH